MNQVSQSDNNLKQLFDEFKFHLIYRNKQTKVTQPVSEEFKVLLEQLKQETRIKRGKKRSIQQMINNRLKFNTQRPSTIQSRFWKPQPVDFVSIENINENLLAVQNEKEFLNAQINNLQTSLVELKKNITSLRKSVETQGLKQEKFKHITYLTHSIDRNTDSTKITNARAYNKMVELQEETLSNLKKFKTALRKQNQQIQSKYNQQKTEKQVSKNKLQLSDNKTRLIEVSNTKIDKNFISRLEELLKLLINKQEEFEQIRVEQTTKIRLKKIQRQYLKQDRAKMQEMIDNFEQKYDVKIQSLANLIIFIFKRLNQDNDYMENKCINLYKIKQSFNQDYQNLCKKQGVISQQQNSLRRQKLCNEAQLKKRIHTNSQMFTKVILLLHNLIAKFKYLFTMALTLSKQKKSFHDLLIQIETLYKPQQIFHNQRISDDLDYDNITNFNQIEQICRSINKQIKKEENDWILGLIFTDVRNSLLCRRKWLEEQLKNNQCINVVDKVDNIQTKCDQAYDSKFKIYSLLLINCLKALNMNKYEKKMIAYSTAKDGIFMSVPKQVKIYNLDDGYADTPQHYKEHTTDTKFSIEESWECNQRSLFTSDPRKIVKALEKLKSQQKTIYRPLKLQQEKVYMYDQKVILPKFIL